ncbi:hypothetical protein M2189_006549 [Bradyrhizobium japonicum]|uniref:hypothetical protein n=1 Tax=Bradyrhizobium japonicum TaxID=375 RepID=UPI0004BC30C8|nr:hypothetical protein [Bradyrhizobium japonicum]MBR0730397.1 hypothetical protein [Bradyrhizobium japonicum]MBR0809686.1 hypothetical protein [Bradyrhizobium japonicum]MCS3503934.1 hypothetical protein [Bradyrhizobium japonicum]MCS3963346.1 hypothetical protein [Bradyrhizobium japonicum]MCS3995659.1 hypothetical protein [Bradyrhizobium japonicum]
MNRLARVLASAAALMLAGCSSVPLTSIPPLARIDARTTDLSMLRVAVQLPDALRPRSGGVKLDVVAKVAGEAETKTSFAMMEMSDPRDRAGLPAPPQGSSTYAYRLSPGDAARFEALRASMVEQGKQGKRGSMGLGVAAREFCRANAAPQGSLPVTIYLMTSETKSFVPVVRDFDLLGDPAMAGGLESIQPCGQ